MHRGIRPHAVYVDEDNIHELADMSFVFICVDKNSVRNLIISKLIQMNIPFVDVGLGVNEVNGQLIGSVRTTTGTPNMHSHIGARICLNDDEVDNEY